MVLFIAIVFMAMLQVAGVASILPFMQLAAEPNSITENKWIAWAYTYFQFETPRSMLIRMGIFVIVLLTVANIFSAFTSWFTVKVAWDINHRITTRMVMNYLKKPYSYYLRRNTSDLLNNTLVEVAQIKTGLIIPAIELAARSIIALVLFALLVLVDPNIAFIVFGTLVGVYSLIYLVFRKILVRLGKRRLRADEKLAKNLNEVLSGIKTFKVFGATDFLFKRFENASSEISDIPPKINLIAATPRYIIETVAFGGILSITIYLLINSENLNAALPLLSLYALAGYRMLPALQFAFSAGAKIKSTYPILDKLHLDIQILAEEEVPVTEEDSIPRFSDTLKFDEVTYIYEATDQPVIDAISVEVPKRKTIAFVGSTGAGKTTLVDLLVGLLSPVTGEITVDGKPLNTSNASSWQKQLGYVPQEVFLFDDSVKRNIAIGVEVGEIDQEKIEQVAKIAHIHNFIVNDLPQGYDTEIGERGVRLSGGQRQRLGLARALYRNPEVLILDEATSALDNITEKSVMNSLGIENNNLTIIIIAHRLSTVRNADCIYLMASGRVIAKGKYNDLLKSSTVFRELVELS